MVEVEHEKDNTRGIAIGGLTTGIIGTALNLLGGGVGNILGGGGNCSNGSPYVNRYEAEQAAELAEAEGRIKLLESNIYTDGKIADVYERLNGKIAVVEAQINSQAVVNAQVAANLSCLTNTVNGLSALTKTIIPISNICPPPMEKYNSWVAPTTPTT